MKKITSSVLAMCALSALSTGCIQEPVKKESGPVTNNSTHVNETIGDQEVELQVINGNVFKEMTFKNKILPSSSIKVSKYLKHKLRNIKPAESIARKHNKMMDAGNNNSLLLGFPIDLLGEQNIFGAVITKVSDKESVNLGVLKLTDLTPLHVKPIITANNGLYYMSLVGCVDACKESSEQKAIINIPIVGLNEEARMIVLDLSALGNELDLVSMLDPMGDYTNLKAIASATTAVDYSLNTLVFDVLTKMIPVTADIGDASAPVTEFTVRWYLKMNSASNPSFESRDATPGVGYFMTSRSNTPKITRFSTTDYGNSIKYYIKNVPTEWQPVFAGALDNWNKEFTSIVGREMLSYEFINQDDPRSEQIVAGDIRYNVIEWDLYNKASYGGLGPSIANQFTGETLSANVLIQGPKIIELYTEWFKTSEEARNLQKEGKKDEANKLLAGFNKSVSKSLKALQQVKYSLKLGKELTMNIRSQTEALEDPIIKGHFEMVPEGVSYKEYMTGYFTEMLEHELGHNLGLRHNFKGSLGSFESKEKGSVSRSIMEYLGRPYRHLNNIGLYDKMAIAYGYAGVAPKRLNWFCTDEDQGSDAETMKTSSAECTKSDATSDPYSYWENRLSRSIDLLVDTKSNEAPLWNVTEVIGEVSDLVNGLSAYALSAEQTADSWTNFFGKGDRPETKEEVKDYVVQSFRKQLCNPALEEIIASKVSVDAQKLAQDNMTMLKGLIKEQTESLGLVMTDALDCK